jgi:hypothetical protein
MLINALNPPAPAVGAAASAPVLAAVGDLDDDEDAGGHTLGDTAGLSVHVDCS